MFMYLSESKAMKLHEKYPAMSFFSVDKDTTAGKIGEKDIQYMYLKDLYPTDDELSGYINGEYTAKKLVKIMKKRMTSVKTDKETTRFQLAVYTMLSMNENTNNDNPIICFIRPKDRKTDPNKNMLDKLYKKYLKVLFDAFGLELFGNYNKKLLKGKRKAARNRISKLVASCSTLNKHGRYRRLIIANTHYAEVQKATLETVLNEISRGGTRDKNVNFISKKRMDGLMNRFMCALSGHNIKDMTGRITKWASKKERDKVMKLLRKRAKLTAELYNEYRDIIKGLNIPSIKKLPKIKKASKMKRDYVAKMMRFYKKNKNVPFMLGAYTHIVCALYDVEVGTKQYNAEMHKAHSLLTKEPDFSKIYNKACTEIRKTIEQETKAAAASVTPVKK